MTTATSDISYFTSSPFQLTAHVAYNTVGYAIAGTLDFDIVLDIDCSSATFDTLTLSDMTMPVLGTSDT